MPDNNSQLDNIIKAERLNELKQRVKKECTRRKYPYGKFKVGTSDKGKPVDIYGQDNWDFNPEPIINNDVLSDQYRKISIPLRKINHENLFPNGPFERTVTDDDLTLFEVNLTALESRAIDNKTTTDCSVSCTGTCTTACTGTCSGSAVGGDTCTGCGSTCSGICGNGCSTSCASTCGNAGCSGYCGVGCIGNCVVSCYSAASKSGQALAYKKVTGEEKTFNTCLDSCVGNCAMGCGNSCGNNCGDACGTYTVSVTTPSYYTAHFSTIHLPRNTEAFSTKANRYWAFTVLKDARMTPSSEMHPKQEFCKGIKGTGPTEYNGTYFDRIDQMPGSGNISVGDAFDAGYRYRVINKQDIYSRNTAENYTSKRSDGMITTGIYYRINILYTNYSTGEN